MTAFTSSVETGCPSGLAPPARAVTADFSPFVRKKNGLNTLTLSVRGATCGGCLSKIETAVSAQSGVQQARLNLSNGKLFVTWTGETTAEEIAGCVSGLGYGVSAFSEDTSAKAAKSEERGLLISMGVAAFALAISCCCQSRSGVGMAKWEKRRAMCCMASQV